MKLIAEGEISRDNFAAATLHIKKMLDEKFMKKKPRIYSFFTMLLIGVFIGIGMGFLRSMDVINVRIDFKTLLFAAVAFIIIVRLANRRYLKVFKQLPYKDGTILGFRQFIITEEGFSEKTDNTISMVRWQKVNRIEETEDMIYVFIDAHAAHFIPKHFFSSDSTCQEYIEALRARIQAVGDSAVTPTAESSA